MGETTNQPQAVIIAGPNGAGKTTFARGYLAAARIPRFLNADLIATGLSPDRPEAAALPAGKLLLQEMEACVEAREHFAVETTLSGRGYVRHIQRWQAAGYRVEMVFLRLSEAGTARERVARRVSEGGHDIPDDVIERRHRAGWTNFIGTYRDLVDAWAIYSADARPARFVASGRKS